MENKFYLSCKGNTMKGNETRLSKHRINVYMITSCKRNNINEKIMCRELKTNQQKNPTTIK